ncbi:MAG: hypothetical protein WC503_05320 [Candidatus Shapirobacteria bacterium]
MTDTPQEPNYQDILTKYADSLKSTEVPPIPEPESQVDPQTQLDSTPSEPQLENEPIVPPTILEPDLEAQIEPEAEPQTAVMTDANPSIETQTPSDIESTPVTPIVFEAEEQVTTPPETNDPVDKPLEVLSDALIIHQPDVQVPPSMQDIPTAPVSNPSENPTDTFVPPSPHPIEIAPDFIPPKENHFFKYLFFFSLFIFVAVAGMIVWTFINSQKSTTNNKDTPATTISPTIASDKICEINGEKYTVGQKFPATDGCNICTCSADLTIACTEKSCDSTNSATEAPSETPSEAPTEALTPTETQL